MKYEPLVDRGRLLESVRAAYGLAAEELTFVPEGYVAACYAVQCTRNERYFLKLWPNTVVGSEGAARLAASLALVRALYERRLLTNVPYPLPTREGALSATFAGSPFAVFPFLPGRVAPHWPGLTQTVRDEFARVLAAIHRATPALADVLPRREIFDVSFEGDLLADLTAVAALESHERPALIELAELIVPRRPEILTQLDRLHRLQDVVRRLDGPLVLCHTDMGGENLLIDDRNRLFVLDWDDATVAPPEHDLQSGLQSSLGEGFESFLRVYLASGGNGHLSLDHFAFYLLRRNLGDMAVRFHRLLTEATTDLEATDLLHGMDAWGFAQWRVLDQRLEAVAAALDNTSTIGAAGGPEWSGASAAGS